MRERDERVSEKVRVSGRVSKGESEGEIRMRVIKCEIVT